ncbi:MAG: arfB [Thermoleophilia bacterium]|nr:arfB [Thermoleophilia bacterium]
MAGGPTPDDDLDLQLPGNRRMPAARIEWRATTSGGPGGQHANKTASRVEVVVRIDELPLEPRERARLYERLASRITGAGELSVAAADDRSQHRNRRTALRRLERLIADALREQRRRVPTRESYGARLRGRASKQHNATRKQSRSWRPSDDD